MKAAFRVLEITFFGLFVVLFFFEALFAFKWFIDHKEWVEETESYYPWSMYTSDGKRVSVNRGGPLKLTLHPGMLHHNFPNQENLHFSINSSGYRGDELIPYNASKRRVVIIGSSAAFGTGLASNNETLAAQLGKLLPDTETVNAAVIGYGSGEELIQIVTEIVDLKPTLVIALDGYNDHDLFGKPVAPHGLGFRSIIQYEDVARNRYLVRHPNVLSRLYFSLRHGLFYRTGDRLANIFQPSTPSASTQASIEQTSFFYATNIIKIDRVLKAFGSNFLCAIQPLKYSYRKNSTRPLRLYKEFRGLVKTRLQKESVDFLDLNDFPEQLSTEHFADSHHLTAEGNAIMARIVAQKVLKDLTPR